MGAENRIGTVSSTDAETGMVSVLYRDRDGEVTQMLPYATFNGEYKLPQVGDKVIVIHLSNGKEMAVVLGTYWNKNHPARNPGAYHKELGERAYFNYHRGVLTIAAEHIQLTATEDNESFSVVSLMKDIKKIKEILDIK